MNTSNRWLALCLAGALLPAHAIANVTVQLGVNPNLSGGTGPVNVVSTVPGPASLSSGLVTGGFSSSGDAQAWAAIGVLKAKGSSEGSLNSVARSIFRDSLKIDVAGLPAGSLVQIAYAIDVSGTLTVNQSNDATAGWQLQADVGGGAFDLGASAKLYNNSPVFAVHGYQGDAMGWQQATTTVQTGFWLPVDVEFTASAQTAYDGHGGPLAQASFDFSNTVLWGGMTVSVNGVPLPAAVVSSQSGFNYLQAAVVPEPASWGLFSLGLCGLALRRRFGARRATQRRA